MYGAHMWIQCNCCTAVCPDLKMIMTSGGRFVSVGPEVTDETNLGLNGMPKGGTHLGECCS